MTPAILIACAALLLGVLSTAMARPASEQEYFPGMEQEYSPQMEQQYSPGMEQAYSPGMEQEYSPGMEQEYSPGIKQQYSLGMEQKFDEATDQGTHCTKLTMPMGLKTSTISYCKVTNNECGSVSVTLKYSGRLTSKVEICHST